MNKAEAIDKVLSLTKLRDSTTHPGERDAAQGRIKRLCQRFDIRPDELIVEDDTSGFTFMGMRADPKLTRMHQERHRVKRTLEFIMSNIEREVEKAFGNMSDIDPGGQAQLAAEFYRELNRLVGNSTAWKWGSKPAVKPRRDAAIKLAYEEEITKGKQWHSRYDGDPASIDWDSAHWRLTLHDRAMGELHTLTEMRLTDIERIVGVKHDDLYWAAVEEEKEEKSG